MPGTGRCLLCSLVCALFLPVLALGQGDPGFSGKWTLIPEKSTEIDLYATLSLEIQQDASTVTIFQTWGSGRSFKDTLKLKTDGSVNQVPVHDRVWPTNVFMGISMQKGETEQVKALWEENGMVLKLEKDYSVLASQGKEQISSIETYQLSPEKETLTLRIDRSTRKTGPEVVYVFKRTGTKEAYFMKLGDNWEIGGKLPEQAFLISLQGIANTDAPRLYFLYPDDWPFTYPKSVFDFYKNQRDYTFTELKTPEEALKTLKEYVKGYVIWDKSVRTSLIVAFTVAGLEKAVIVSEEMVPMVESFGLKPVADFRGKFTGQSDAQIYTWAYDQYGARCSKDFVIWLGGEAGKVMKPAIADFGILKQVFFTDLSTKPSDTEEYALSKKILSEMKPLSMVMGWHSYAKDLERDFVKLTSSYALRVEGLNTLPNVSFSYHVPATPGFKFKNNHHLVPGKTYTPEKKVYISCIQTDGIGLGAWLKPGRGEIPYAWEVTMNWLWMAPSMLEYFYGMATPNDYFIGALSGPGYMYPKAIPPRYLPAVVDKAYDLMKQLDLNVFEIMDYSEGATVEGNTELTKEVVDAYYKGMPDAIGFVNGYAPAFTFTVKDGKPLISYDYYLSPTRPEADAVADLEELASINAKRPYFLLLHVRESSDIKRVKGILSKLGSEFELVPLDIFLTMAGQEPTFQERFLKR
jgi:hypothetical protein